MIKLTLTLCNALVKMIFWVISKTHHRKCTHSLGKVQHNTASLECRQNKNHRDLPQFVGRKIAYILTIRIVMGLDILTQKTHLRTHHLNKQTLTFHFKFFALNKS